MGRRSPLIPASILGTLLTPALPFVVPSSEVSLARIWGLGARRVKKFTVPASVVRPPPQSSTDNRYGQPSFPVGSWSGTEGRHRGEAAPARPYRSGRSRHWVKSKNPKHPAVKREAEEDWGRTKHV